MGDINKLRQLVDYKKCILARHPQTLATCLHLAVIHNHADILQLLLEKSVAYLDSKDNVKFQ